MNPSDNQPTPTEEGCDRVARLAVDILRPFARTDDDLKELIDIAACYARDYAGGIINGKQVA